MQIGEVIRRCRKNKNMTQEEMAVRLGVTAPAVNKWENGNSLPDITLLSPIARLLGITVDGLLSFHETLTPEEISRIVQEMDSMFREKPYAQVFDWAMEKLEEYPNCEELIWQVALILNARLMTGNIFGEYTEEVGGETGACFVSPFSISPDVPAPAPDHPKQATGGASSKQPPSAGTAQGSFPDPSAADTAWYESRICSLFERVLAGNDELLRSSGADSLFGFYMRKKQYDKAQEYLPYFSIQNPERKRKQAELYHATGRTQEALKAWEELLLDQYRMVSVVLHEMYLDAVQNQDMERAHLLVEKECGIAGCFEMGVLHEVAPRLELATLEKDREAVIAIAEKMLSGLDHACDFCHSRLYEHMTFQEISPEFLTQMRADLLKCFRDEETYGFMKTDERWQRLVEEQES